MSSAAAADPTTTPQTLDQFWCYECAARVTLHLSDHPSPPPPPPPPLICPHCGGGFLEESPDLDSNPLQIARSPTLTLNLTPLDPDPDSGSDSDDSGLSPASISVVDSLPSADVSDASVPCAVCKDDFDPLSDAAQLPCRHVYHRACIVPWLARSNSCPLCRSPLPSGSPRPRRRARLTGPPWNWSWNLSDDASEDPPETLPLPLIDFPAMMAERALQTIRAALLEMNSERNRPGSAGSRTRTEADSNTREGEDNGADV